MSPVVLAANLGIKPKTLRRWLREHTPRKPTEKHQRWEIPEDVAKEAWWYFRGQHL